MKESPPIPTPERRSLPRRLLAFGQFTLIFLREFLLANLAMVHAVLRQPLSEFYPDFVTYDLDGLRPLEIVILTHCITLTPGTTSVEISPDRRTLVLHAFDARDPDGLRADIRRKFHEPILRFTRSK